MVGDRYAYYMSTYNVRQHSHYLGTAISPDKLALLCQQGPELT